MDCFNPGAYHPRFADALAAASNPAALALCSSFSAGIYGARKFMLAEVQHFLLAAAMPLGKDGLGVQVDHFAAPAYVQTSVGIGYAKKLGDVLVGTRFQYITTQVQGYGKFSGLDVEAGTNWRLTDQLRVNMSVYLPAAGAWKSAYRYRMGIGYKVSDHVLLVLEAFKEEHKPSAIHIGIYYQPASQWLLQMGMVTGGTQLYAGAGFQWHAWRILVNVIHSQLLGPSPGLAVILPPKSADR